MVRLPLPLAPALTSAVEALTRVHTLVSAGLVTPTRPDRLLGMGAAVLRWGISPAAGYDAGAARHPDRIAVIDDETSVTFHDVARRSDNLAREMAGLGLEAGAAIGLLARNCADFVIVATAAAKAGVDVVHLNTGFAGPALAEVCDAEGVRALFFDEEFTDLLSAALPGRAAVLVRATSPAPSSPTVHELALRPGPRPGRPGRHSRPIILTSGTTGRAKGASRETPGGLSGLDPLTAILEAIPLRARETTVVAAPMFHMWGYTHLTLAMVLGSTIVVSRRFDPEETLRMVAEHKASALAVVPVMLQRILDLPREVRDRHDLSSLRVVPVSGSALPAEVSRRWLTEVGPNLYNLYGSTEVAYASVAGPADLLAAPGTVGRPPRGARVQILDPEGRLAAPGEVGRIFVGNAMAFGGYTSGADKERVDGMVATGDVGRFDEDGRLFVEGRDDDMIVSGGENVFPQEVEELLMTHQDITDVAVVGVPDEQFGQRLAAHLVTKRAAGLDGAAVKAFVKANLAGYKVPRDVVFHDELPRNATGKVLKRELRESAAGAPSAASGGDDVHAGGE